jgi:hypothetical protein
MNWKGLGIKRSQPNFLVLSRHLPGGNKKNHENLQSGKPVFGTRFEPMAFKIRSSSVNHSTTLGELILNKILY